MLNLNLNSMLCNNRPPFTPPNSSEAQQWLTGAEEDNPSFPDYKYLPDNSGNGAFALHDTTPKVVDAAVADRVGFNNDGNDYARSALTQYPPVTGSINPFTTSFIFKMDVFYILTGTTTIFIHIGGTAVGARYFQIGVNNSDKLTLFVGNVAISTNLDICLDGVSSIVVVYDYGAQTVVVSCDGVSETIDISVSGAVGDYSPLWIGSFGGGTLGGRYLLLSAGFYTPDEELIDNILDSFVISGATITTSLGYVLNVTDEIPTTALSKGIATKYNLNAHGLVTTTGFAGDEWLTTKEFAALHNNTTRFTSDSGLSVLRSLPYDDINTLDAGKIAKINRYMGR